MARCKCCGNNGARWGAPQCDRCFLGWNGDCCAIYATIEQANADSSRHVCEEMGFYEVPFSLQIKRTNRKIRKENASREALTS